MVCPAVSTVATPTASQVPLSTARRLGPFSSPVGISSSGSPSARRMIGSLTPMCTSTAPAATYAMA